MRPTELSPRERCRLHACRRLWQRQGIALGDAEYEAIVAGIRAGLYKMMAYGHHDRPIYEVTYRQKTVYAVWSNIDDCIITFLPCKAWYERRYSGPLLPRPDRVAERARVSA